MKKNLLLFLFCLITNQAFSQLLEIVSGFSLYTEWGTKVKQKITFDAEEGAILSFDYELTQRWVNERANLNVLFDDVSILKELGTCSRSFNYTIKSEGTHSVVFELYGGECIRANISNIVLNHSIVEIEGIRYKLFESGIASIMKSPNFNKENLNIPGKITFKDVEYDVVEITDEAFAANNKVVSIKIPSSIEKISPTAFCYINSPSIYVDSNNSKYDSRENSNIIVETSTNTVVVGGCNKTIPKSVTSIGQYAYCGRDIVEIEINENILDIKENAFKDCACLKSMSILSTLPICCSKEAFMGVKNGECELLVPIQNVYYYSNTEPFFSTFSPITAISNDYCLLDKKESFFNEHMFNANVFYTRIFNNTNWQALYVPIAMNYADWSDDFEIARINDVHQFDNDNDGTIDETKVELIRVANGIIEPNTPYLIKAKSVGEKTITLTNATLYTTEEKSYDVTSWNTKFTFTGTYHTIPGSEMEANGYYALGGGKLVQAQDATANLGAFRWYLSVTDRDGNPKDVNEVKMMFIGFDDFDEETAVEGITTDNSHQATVYNLNGTKVEGKNLKAGIYIKNGKKIVVK